MTDQQAKEDELLSCYKRVAHKILAQAIKDYKAASYATSKKQKTHVELDCESFFRSDWFAELAGIAGYDKFQSANERARLIYQLRHSTRAKTQLRKLKKEMEEDDEE